VTSDIHQLIAAIHPEVFCAPAGRRAVKRILNAAKAGGSLPDYARAADKAMPLDPNHLPVEELEQENPFRLPGFKSPTERHRLSYDAFDESLEAFYFRLLDDLTADGWAVSKLADTFAATPASGLFSDLTRRETQAQREAMKLLREAHALVRDLLRDAAWRTAAANPSAPDETGGRSDQPIERSLLQSKIESLKLYARWLGPYLRQARQTRQSDNGGPALVNLFNTATAEVTLLAQKNYAVAEDVARGELPRMFLNARHREFFSVLIIELKLRAAPERNPPGGYGYRGRFELTLTSYALSGDELAGLRRELDRENLGELVHAVGESSATVLQQLVAEMDSLLVEPQPAATGTTDTNPFSALFDFSGWFGEGEARTQDAPAMVTLRPDSDIEQVIRSQALLDARRRCQECYRRCKQAFGMVCF
jgi:hypothetical protein